jgi:sulfatase maturation enzyme AslB (radical SAM superfamily)
LLNPYYDAVVKNINICAHVKEAFDLINLILANNDQKYEHYLRIFDDILNLVEEAKILALKCLQLVDPASLPIDLSLALKLRVLE